MLGGSQGALQINRIAYSLIQRTDLRFHWTLQCGASHVQEVSAQLPTQKYPHVTILGYTAQIAQLYAQAHILLCRAGAGVLTEALCFGLPLLLVPYPYASDGHQDANADYLGQMGAALSFHQKDSNPDTIKQTLELLSKNPKKMLAMQKVALTLAEPQASSKISTIIENARAI